MTPEESAERARLNLKFLHETVSGALAMGDCLLLYLQQLGMQQDAMGVKALLERIRRLYPLPPAE